MSLATFEGIVENGQVRLPSDVRLPENAKVYILVVEEETDYVTLQTLPSTVRLHSPRLSSPEDGLRLQKEVIVEPGDARI